MQTKPFLLRGGFGFALGLALATAAAAQGTNCSVTYENNSDKNENGQTTFNTQFQLFAGDAFYLDGHEFDRADIGPNSRPYGSNDRMKLGPGKTIRFMLAGTSCQMMANILNDDGTDYQISLVEATGSSHNTQCDEDSSKDFMKTYGCDCSHSGDNYNSDITIACTGSGS